MIPLDACIIVAHGSQGEKTVSVLASLQEQLATRPEMAGIPVSFAFLRLNEPSLPEQVRRHYQEGCRTIRLMPLFIFDGVHVSQEIPALCANLEKDLPGLHLEQARSIGADPLLAEMILGRLLADHS
jgi:sirohydrochlorin ferrochelatase